MTETIQSDSLVVLHYRLSLEDGTRVLDTFNGRPATLQLGHGELLPQLETLLVGMTTGTRRSFHLAPGQAFGEWQTQAMQSIARNQLPEDVHSSSQLVSFSSEDGSTLTGRICALDDDAAQVDFNHPLAGRHVTFDVEIMGIL